MCVMPFSEVSGNINPYITTFQPTQIGVGGLGGFSSSSENSFDGLYHELLAPLQSLHRANDLRR